jgi:hypothetical protein
MTNKGREQIQIDTKEIPNGINVELSVGKRYNVSH